MKLEKQIKDLQAEIVYIQGLEGEYNPPTQPLFPYNPSPFQWQEGVPSGPIIRTHTHANTATVDTGNLVVEELEPQEQEAMVDHLTQALEDARAQVDIEQWESD